MASFGTDVSPELLVENVAGAAAAGNVPDRPAAGTVMQVRDAVTAMALPDVTLSTFGHWSQNFDGTYAIQVSFDSGASWGPVILGDTARAALVSVAGLYINGALGGGASLDALNALQARVEALEAGTGGGTGAGVTPASLAAVVDGAGGINVGVVAGDGEDPDKLLVALDSPGLDQTPTVHQCPTGLVARPATTRPVQWVVRASDFSALGSNGTTAGGTTAAVAGLDLVDVIQ